MFANREQIKHEILVSYTDICVEIEPSSALENYFFSNVVILHRKSGLRSYKIHQGQYEIGP